MVIGTLGLALATYTPLFNWLSMPLIPLLRPYNMATKAAPFDSLQVADLGDVAIRCQEDQASHNRLASQHSIKAASIQAGQSTPLMSLLDL